MMPTLSETITPELRNEWILEIRGWVAAFLKLGVHQTEQLLRVATAEELSRIHLAWTYPEHDRPAIVRQVIQPLYSRLPAA